MNFEIDKREFLKGLSFIQSITAKKDDPSHSHPCSYGIAERVPFILLGTDLEIGIREELPAKVHEEGKASVSAKKLYEIIRELPEKKPFIFRKKRTTGLRFDVENRSSTLLDWIRKNFLLFQLIRTRIFSRFHARLLIGDD